MVVTLGLMTVTTKFIVTAATTKLVETAVMTELVLTDATTNLVLSAYFYESCGWVGFLHEMWLHLAS